MSKCLTDNQVSAFLDGDSKERSETISHLNSCANCFEQVTTVRNYIRENSELCDQIDHSYENMISDNILLFYLKNSNKIITNYFNSLIPSNGVLNLLSGYAFSRYSAIVATAVTVAFVVFIGRSGQQVSPNSEIIWEAASKSYSNSNQESEINILKDKNYDEIFKEIEEEPDKKNAFELGKNIMKMEAMFDFGEIEDFPVIFKEIVSNPLINKLDNQIKYDSNDIEIEEVKNKIDTYLNNIDPNLIDYVEFGLYVETAKEDSAEPSLKNKVNELDISIDDIKKYDEIIKHTGKDN
jgi:hypothetical protein